MFKSRNNHPQLEIVQERGGYVAYMIVPPDGGWGWVIIFVTFLGCVILDGVSFSFSSFRKPIADSLSINSTEVAMLNSIFIGIYFVACIVSCAVANRYGFRVIMVIGSVVLVISFAVTGVLTNIFEMYIVYSIIGGIGAGLVSICIVLPPGFYFDKKRPMAMGLSSSGTGVGAICVPPLMEICVNTYGWRNSLFIEGGILSLLIILGCFLRPLEPIKVNVGVNENMQDTDSVTEQYMFTTLPDVFSMRSVITQRSTMLANSAVADYPTLSHLADNARGSISLENAPPKMIPRLKQMLTSSRMGESLSSTTLQRRVHGHISRAELVSKPRQLKKNILQHSKTPGARPLYRTDVLYQGSLMRLDTYTEKDKEIEYHLDVTRPATQKDITEETERKCVLCPEAVRRGLSTLIDCKLLKSPTFLCLATCALFNYISFYIPFLYIGERAQAFGMGKYETILVSMIGIGLTVGRILSGILITIYPNFSAFACTILTCNVAGLAALATTWYNQEAYQIICMTTFGFAAGIFSPLRSIMIVDFMGLDQLTTATGMIIFFQGIGSLVGPPIADCVKNSLNDTNAPFYLTSISLFLSALILLPMKKIYKWEIKRRTISLNIHH